MLQPPCKIPHGASGEQHIGLKVESLLKKQLLLLSNLHGSPMFLETTSLSIGASSEKYKENMLRQIHTVSFI